VLGKRRVPPLLENLQHGLLDQSVDDARHAELSDPNQCKITQALALIFRLPRELLTHQTVTGSQADQIRSNSRSLLGIRS
jgi:hypothetical protein